MKPISNTLRWLVIASLLVPSLSFAQDAPAAPSATTPASAVTSTKATHKLRTLSGKITSVSGTTVVISDTKSVSYTVDATNAKLVRRFGAKMAVADIQVGDMLTVQGTVDGTNVAAKMIRDMSLQAHNGSFEGSVQTVNGASFTLKTSKRDRQTINTDSSTVFKKNGKIGALSDVVVGAMVKVEGVWDRANSNVTAKTVNVIVKMKEIKISGTLSAKTDTMLTVKDAKGATYNVDITHAHLVRKNGGKSMVSEFNVGDSVQVMGKHQGDSMDVTATIVKDTSITATSVKGATPPSTPASAPGGN